VSQLHKYIHLYIGCNTNKGRLVGIRHEYLFIEAESEDTVTEYHIKQLGDDLFLYLHNFNDLTEEQRKELVKRGMAIGRPSGYTFSKESFLYLICLNVDLYGLIDSGYAIGISIQ
jgi:hypothetical protein